MFTMLFSILANLNYAVVKMVLIILLIPNSSSLFTKPFETHTSAPITIGITVIFLFHRFFCSFAKFQLFVYFYTFFYLHYVVCRDATRCPVFFSLLILDLDFWPDLVICLCPKIPENFMHQIHWDRFWCYFCCVVFQEHLYYNWIIIIQVVYSPLVILI